jgi:hypothetical protein
MKIKDLVNEDGVPVKPDWKFGKTEEEIKEIENLVDSDVTLLTIRKIRDHLKDSINKDVIDENR